MSSNVLHLETDDPASAVSVKDGVVAFLGGKAPPGAARLDCRGALIEPGFVNAHTHLYSGLSGFDMPPPHAPPRSFLQILDRVWWRLDRALDDTILRAAARFYVAEALLQGTTTLIDHHESPHFIEGSLDVLADACQELGMRALLCYGATERNEGKKEASRGLEECRRFIRANERPLVRGLVGLHASFTVSDDTLHDAAALVRETRSVLHTHVAEDVADLEDARRRGYPGPLERLLKLDALVSGSILAHGVHLSVRQVERAAERKCWIVQNPRSNLANHVGYPAALWASEHVALGTDGYPASMLSEEAALFREAKTRGSQEVQASARRLDAGLDLVAERFGKIFAPVGEGTVADLLVMPHAREGEPLLRHVVVGGRVVVKDGALQTGDIEEIRLRAREEAMRLWRRMEQIH